MTKTPKPGKTAVKKHDLRQRLLSSARLHIEKTGLLGLRARDITHDAGCALGGLYTAFADLDALIIAVNSQTLELLDEALQAAIAGFASPGDKLKSLGQTYLAFASTHPRLWRALFEHRLPDGSTFPDWHEANQLKLLMHIAKPLASLQPDLSDEALMIRTRTLFAAVHGIVSISLDNRFVGIPTANLGQEIDHFISQLLRGLNAER
jgi:AcrR family transcriptional regulator